ncbi:MAG: hypothetical protein V4692_14370, partial [Bdellovibrionota bacterium]
FTGNIETCGGIPANCTGSNTGVVDFFVTKYNSSGTWQWSEQLGQAGTISAYNSLAIGPDGHLYGGVWTTGNMPSCGGVSSQCSGAGAGSDYFLFQIRND